MSTLRSALLKVDVASVVDGGVGFCIDTMSSGLITGAEMSAVEGILRMRGGGAARVFGTSWELDSPSLGDCLKMERTGLVANLGLVAGETYGSDAAEDEIVNE
jgi:hypothetical protein